MPNQLCTWKHAKWCLRFWHDRHFYKSLGICTSYLLLFHETSSELSLITLLSTTLMVKCISWEEFRDLAEYFDLSSASLFLVWLPFLNLFGRGATALTSCEIVSFNPLLAEDINFIRYELDIRINMLSVCGDELVLIFRRIFLELFECDTAFRKLRVLYDVALKWTSHDFRNCALIINSSEKILWRCIVMKFRICIV